MILHPMIGQIVGVLHHPFSLFGVLPLTDRFRRIYFGIFDCTHGENVEVDLHLVAVSALDRPDRELCRHRKDLGDHLGTGTSYRLVLLLCAIGTPELNEMHPRSQGTIHIEAAFS